MLDKPQPPVQPPRDKSPALAATPAAQPAATKPDDALLPASAVQVNLAAASPAAVPTPPLKQTSNPATKQTSITKNTAAASPPAAPPLNSGAATSKPTLFEQRLEAGKLLLEQKNTVASIQLYYNEEVNPARIEGFLKRANALGVLSKIYLLPADFGGKHGMRVVYGAYSSIEAAHNAVKDLPARYQEAFATSTYIF
jgi:hypothetical protein